MPDIAAVRIRHLLIIDSDTLTETALRPYFGEQGYRVMAALTGADGLNEALAHPPSLILLAVTLPDSAGIDVFRRLRSRARTAHIPVMFLAEHVEARQQNELLGAGADDFITKPFDLDILGLRVRNAIQRNERDGLHHPRSGMPTGRLIQERVRALADEYSWYKIDFVIENFDTFREAYGFMTGEEVLGFTAGLVNEAVQEAGTPDDFIGQRSDTEFVIVTKLANGPKLRDLLERRFNEEVLAFYSFVERDQGYLEVDDGAGGRTRKSLMVTRLKVQEGESEDESPVS